MVVATPSNIVDPTGQRHSSCHPGNSHCVSCTLEISLFLAPMLTSSALVTLFSLAFPSLLCMSSSPTFINLKNTCKKVERLLKVGNNPKKE